MDMDTIRKVIQPLRSKPVRAAIATLIGTYLVLFGVEISVEQVAQFVGMAAMALLAWVGDEPATS